MKTKSLLFIVAALILLSFTVVTKQSTKEVATNEAQPVQTSTGGGFAMEDRNQW